MSPLTRKNAIQILVLLPLLLTLGCAGLGGPPIPLWDPASFNTVAVLPVRMTVLTGREYFKSEDTDISNRMGGMMQEALSVVMVHRGYDVLAPEDLSERLMEEEDLSEAFTALASAFGYMGNQGNASPEEVMASASIIGEKLGVDLLVLAHGNGEYHSFEENLFQGVVTGLLSKGKEYYDTPESFLRAEAYFVDSRTGSRVARILPRRLPYEKTVAALSRRLNGLLRRVPAKGIPEEYPQP